MVNWIKRTSSMKGIIVDGQWVEEPKVVKLEIKKYFDGRFKKEGGSTNEVI